MYAEKHILHYWIWLSASTSLFFILGVFQQLTFVALLPSSGFNQPSKSVFVPGIIYTHYFPIFPFFKCHTCQGKGNAIDKTHLYSFSKECLPANQVSKCEGAASGPLTSGWVEKGLVAVAWESPVAPQAAHVPALMESEEQHQSLDRQGKLSAPVVKGQVVRQMLVRG